ncbi:MAG: hypothetical protein J6S89_09165 [Paludibacteraceae bacterium]|nr:hypothetical protein [Paludibacteraceae bacterium]MBO7636733.1 hypothetical protein [Paludibacteraceae bacterium]
MKARDTLIFLCSILLALVGLCFFYPDDGVTIHGKKLRFPSLAEAMAKGNTDTETAEDKLRRAEEELRLKIEQDSLNRVYEAELADSIAFTDTLKSYQKLLFETTAKLSYPNDDPSILFSLFDCLDKCADGKDAIHILHYGDSQIEQDRISGYIREELQNRFGGWGPGLVPAIQPIPSLSVAQSSSDSIPRYIADGTLRQKLSHDRYGVLAQMAEVDGSVSLSFASRKWKKTFAHARKFSKISLLVGNTNAGFSATLVANGKDSTQTIKKEQKGMTKLTWQLGSHVSNISLRLKGKAEIYGISMDSKSGVFVDNIPLRGSSGTFFTKISSQLLSESMKKMNVKLVLMEFGGNATPHLKKDESISNFKKNIGRQIAYVKKLNPGAKIIFIGPADMNTMVDGKLQSYEKLEPIIDSLKSVALENGAMFWDMYDVMGGKNSMQKWVKHSPAWATTDYIHFTEKGASRIAEVFMQSFNNSYEYYHFLRRNKKWSKIK